MNERNSEWVNAPAMKWWEMAKQRHERRWDERKWTTWMVNWLEMECNWNELKWISSHMRWHEMKWDERNRSINRFGLYWMNLIELSSSELNWMSDMWWNVMKWDEMERQMERLDLLWIKLNEWMIDRKMVEMKRHEMT